MKSQKWFSTALVLIVLLALKILAPARADTATDEQIKRGEYLVERAAMCGDCHTPHKLSGEPDRKKWLLGQTLPFKPIYRIDFAPVAPQIAGLPTMPTDEMAIRFLETGTNALGRTARLPMPQFRFEHDDAVAVVAYLRSLRK
jgi:hypothetical protein